MIEQSLYSYLKAQPSLVALVGENIFMVQAPKDTPMPYLVVENTGGSRKKLTSNLTQEIALYRITVDAGPSQLNRGQQIIQEALHLLENYRGNLGNTIKANDCFLTCSSIRGWAGIAGAYRYMFDGEALFTEVRIENP